MNKQQLIGKIARDLGSSKRLAGDAAAALLGAITKALKKGDAVTLIGFGTFKTSRRKARMARNPQTGARIRIPKRKIVRFIPGKALKQAIG